MIRRRTKIEAHHDKMTAVRDAESTGLVADSLDVRMALLARVERGEITLEQCQAEIKAIRRGAAKAGKVTRARVYRQG